MLEDEDWRPPVVRVALLPTARLVPLVGQLRNVWSGTPLSEAVVRAREGFERELREALKGLASVEAL